MADKFRSLIKVIGNELYKYRLFNNTTTTIGNTTEKVQGNLMNVQSTVVARYNNILKQINNDTTVHPLPNKVVKWWKWYQQLTGLDVVELSKVRVTAAQEKLFQCGDERRRLSREAIIWNEKLKEIYAELVQTKRDDPRYVQLTIIENKSLQEQAKIVAQLNLLEMEEKDHFAVLATAIKEYHDSQTMNAQKHRYMSMILSALLAIASLISSMVYNNKRIRDVSYAIIEAQKKNEAVLVTGFSSLKNNVNSQCSDILTKLGQINSTHNSQPLTVVQQQSEPLKSVPSSAGGIFSLNTLYLPYVYAAIGVGAGYVFLKGLFGW